MAFFGKWFDEHLRNFGNQGHEESVEFVDLAKSFSTRVWSQNRRRCSRERTEKIRFGEWTFSWKWVSMVALAVPRSVCLLVCVADIPEPFLLKLPSAVPSTSSFSNCWCCHAYFRFFSPRVSPALRLLQSVGYFLRIVQKIL